jgi:hypothetical protein
VGIGTTTPSAKLDVEGKVYIGGTSHSSLGDYHTLIVGDRNIGDGKSSILLNPTSSDGGMGIFFSSVDNELTFRDWGTGSAPARLTIERSGNVGIGTTTPSHRLVVKPTGASGILLGAWNAGGAFNGISLNNDLSLGGYNLLSGQSNGTFYLNRKTGGDMHFRENNLTQMVLKSGGNIGIGTTIPTEKLQIDNGNFKLNQGAIDILKGHTHITSSTVSGSS